MSRRPGHRGWRGLVLLGAVALAAVPVTAGAAAPAPQPGDAAATTAAFVDASPYVPLTRLGRWDGTTLQPVTAGSVTSDHVVVVTHGWAVGLKPAYDRLQAASAQLVTIWDPALTDAGGVSPMQNFGPLLGALQTADPAAAVLMFSWVDQSATTFDPLTARDAENATEINGHRLAVAVDQALGPAWSGQLHLIGHSFGANVATTAALAVAASPRQLTLMDSPEVALARFGGAMNDLRYKLPRLAPGRLPGQTFVDSYISLVGAPYSGLPGLDQVVDVRLAPPAGDNAGQEHEYPTVWYREALQAKGNPPTGPWWSPLLGGDPTAAGRSYEEQDRATPTVLTQLEPAPPATTADAMAVTTAPLELAGAGASAGAGAAGASSISLAADATTVATVSFPTDVSSLTLEFDVGFAAPAGTLTLAVDGRARYTASAPTLGTRANGAFVLLWDVEPGEHTLTATLTDAAAGSRVTLSDLRIASTADIVRNLTAEETDVLVVVVLVAIGAVLFGLLVAAVLIVRRVIRKRRESSRAEVGSI
jgi:hypothetical protein